MLSGQAERTIGHSQKLSIMSVFQFDGKYLVIHTTTGDLISL